jgi:hypothetical protein
MEREGQGHLYSFPHAGATRKWPDQDQGHSLPRQPSSRYESCRGQHGMRTETETLGARGDQGLRSWQSGSTYLSGRDWGWGFGSLWRLSHEDAGDLGHGQPHRGHLGEQPGRTGWSAGILQSHSPPEEAEKKAGKRWVWEL